MAWVLPSVLSASASTAVDSTAKAAMIHFNADISAYTERLVILLSLTTLPALLRAPGGIRAAVNAVPWWWSLLFVRIHPTFAFAQLSNPHFSPKLPTAGFPPAAVDGLAGE